MLSHQPGSLRSLDKTLHWQSGADWYVALQSLSNTTSKSVQWKLYRVPYMEDQSVLHTGFSVAKGAYVHWCTH